MFINGISGVICKTKALPKQWLKCQSNITTLLQKQLIFYHKMQNLISLFYFKRQKLQSKHMKVRQTQECSYAEQKN